jgi:hypothetical protein
MSSRRLILIPIDLHSINRRSLETLVHLARRLDRGLLALLLEDIRLQQVADLPFTTEITLSGSGERSLQRDHLSVRHNRVINSTRKMLSELAQRNRVELLFEETSGQRLHCSLGRDGEIDVFFPPRHQWLLPATGGGSRPLFINRLGVLLTHTEQGRRVLEAAHTLLHSGQVGDVYLLAENEPSAEQRHALSRPGHRLSVQTGFRCDPIALAMLLRRSPYDLLLLPRNCLGGIAYQELDNALETSGGEILLIS